MPWPKGKSHPPTRTPDDWRTKLSRALRDDRGANLSATDVRGLCFVLDIEPAPITRYLRRIGTIATIKADESMTIAQSLRVTKPVQPAVARRRRKVRAQLERRQIEKSLDKRSHRGLAERNKNLKRRGRRR